MVRPDIRLFLVRHGLSLANVSKSINAGMPDHAIPLADVGHEQALAAGVAIAEHISDHLADHVIETVGGITFAPRRMRLLVSPYLRTRQTADGVGSALESAGLRFDRREVPELREISFGLFDGIDDEDLATEFPREFAHYEKHKKFEGEYFAPMPMGESRIQVGDRVKQMFGTILRDAEPRDNGEPILDFVIVSHGVTIRQFIHRWCHHPWEWAEKEPNPWNCSVRLIRGRSGRGYAESTVFEGFQHHRDARDHREDGKVA